MKNILHILLMLALLLNAFYGFAAQPVVKAEASPYWWTLLVIPGFVILWIVRRKRM